MKTSVIEVRGLLSTLSARGVEKQLAQLQGVKRVDVNYISGSATVVYDETVIALQVINAKVEECGYHCSGERLPTHLCEAEDPHSKTMVTIPRGHTGHGHDDSQNTALASKPADHAERKKAPQHSKQADNIDSTLHEMGHGAGMDMQAMVRDMRNRFWIALVFSLPIFVFSPMGMDFIRDPAAIRSAAGSRPVRSGQRRHPLSGLALRRRGLPCAPQRCRQYGGAGRPQRRYGISVQRRLDILLRRRAVLRSVGNSAGLHPARALARNAREGRSIRSHSRPDGSGAAQGHRAA